MPYNIRSTNSEFFIGDGRKINIANGNISSARLCDTKKVLPVSNLITDRYDERAFTIDSVNDKHPHVVMKSLYEIYTHYTTRRHSSTSYIAPFFIAGSAATCLLFDKNQTPNDIDIYSMTKTAYEQLKHAFSYAFLLEKETKFSVTFDVDSHRRLSMMLPSDKIQLIKPFQTTRGLQYGRPMDVIHTFDFTATRAAILYKPHSNDVLSISDVDTPSDVANKLIRSINPQNALALLYRMTKYVKKGYAPTYGLYSELIQKIVSEYSSSSEKYQNILLSLNYLDKVLAGESVENIEISPDWGESYAALMEIVGYVPENNPVYDFIF